MRATLNGTRPHPSFIIEARKYEKARLTENEPDATPCRGKLHKYGVKQGRALLGIAWHYLALLGIAGHGLALLGIA